MGDSYDVAVVGGGIIGLSIARELKRAGVDRVVVLEREPSVGQWSSSRANGGVRAQFTTPINIAFSIWSIGEFEMLQNVSGGSLSFHQTGHLLFTGTQQGEDQLRTAYDLQRSLGVPTEWLGPDEIVERAPLIRGDGLRAGTFHERDGFLDPYGALMVMKQEAQRNGAEIRTRAGVTVIRTHGGSFSLSTEAGEVDAAWVVNAAGAHARAVGELAGVEVPVDPVRRNLAYAAGPAGSDELIPMCVDVDTGVLVRKEERGGYVIAYSNPDDPPGWHVSVDPRFLEDLAQRIGNRFPTLEDIPIDTKQCWAGLYPETEDHHAIIGAAPGLERFVLCVGFGGHGIMHSPATGRRSRNWLPEGGPRPSTWRRCGRRVSRRATSWSRQRCCEEARHLDVAVALGALIMKRRPTREG
jgi:sarcosine oxidase subunit beta